MEAVPRGAAALRLSGVLDPSGVERVRLWRVAVPLVRPLVASHGTETDRCSTLVEVTLGSGATGWGECPALARPTYTGEYAAGAWRLLVDELVPAALAGRGDDVRGHPMARFALEAGLADARLREAGLALVDVVAPGGPRALARAVVVGGRRDADETVAAVGAAVDAGATLVKLKVEPGWAREPLEAVRGAYPALALAADANGSFAGCAPVDLAFADEVGLAYLEQPERPGDLVAHAALAGRGLVTPLALDESLGSLDQVRAALALGAMRAANLKPARVGGLVAALEALDWCAERGVAAYVGGMLELGVGRAAAAAVAARVASAGTVTGWPTDLGPSSQYVVDDVTEPVVLDGAGRLVVPRGAGIGLEVDTARVRSLAAEVVEVRP